MIDIRTKQAQMVAVTADNICRAIEATKTVILPQYEGMDEASTLKSVTLSWVVDGSHGNVSVTVSFDTDKDDYRPSFNGTEYWCRNLEGLRNCLVTELRKRT